MRNGTKENILLYFQAFTNTHAQVEVLKEKFEPVLKEPGVVGTIYWYAS